MELDKFTFGKTPASIYLVDLLNVKKDIVLNKKITRFLTGHRLLVKELFASNEAGLLSAKNLSSLLLDLRKTIQFSAGSEIINNLVSNIAIGDIKTGIRKTQTLRKIESQQVKLKRFTVGKDGLVKNKEGYVLAVSDDEELIVQKYRVNDLKEDDTVSRLVKKWENRNARKNRGVF